MLVPTGSADRLRTYQPMMPAPLGPPQMGGSGLSGLALADDADGWPGPWGACPGATPGERVFYVANPITNQIQSIIATRAGERYTYRRGPDLLTSADPAFRPVAIQFGPDGCLYVVDWYNKIISHNEVPRNHPDRDRERGRIWRIRHPSQPVREPMAVGKLPTEQLPEQLGAANARIADFAWQEIVDRQATTLVPVLEQRAAAQADVPEVAAALERLALDPASRGATLRSLLSFRTSLPNPGIEALVAKAAAALFAEGGTGPDAALAIDLAGAYKLRSLEPQVANVAADPTGDLEQRRAAIRCLRELHAISVGTMQTLRSATDADPRLRADTLAACVESRDPATCTAIVAAWDDLAIGDRPAAAAGLARNREGATALLAAFAADAIDPASLPISVLADMRLVLDGNPQLETIWSGLTAGAAGSLRLTGADAGAGPAVSLAGPFTVEAWVNLEAPIDNRDSLLAAPGVIDINFYGQRFRVWTPGYHDIVVATSNTTPDTWTHYAVTRDAQGVFRIYVDGELDAESAARETIPYPNPRVGWSTPSGGTQGRLAEFRVWNQARTADEMCSTGSLTGAPR